MKSKASERQGSTAADCGPSIAGLVDELNTLKSKHLYRKFRVLDSMRGVRAKIERRDILLFCSNDYLGLSQHPEIIDALTRSARDFGAGAGASRLISGSSAPVRRLEEALAAFKQKERALVFASGYAANIGTISALCGKEDVVVVDKLNHASVVDGCRLSGASIRVYPHGDMSYLEKILKQSGRFRRRLIVTDSLFSMDGDLAPLPEIVRLKERYGAWLMVDEAHGTGVFGARGRGVAEHFGVEGTVDISMGTLSKAIGTMGGFIAGDGEMIDYLINRSRSFIFSTALPPAIAAASLQSVELITRDASLRKALWRNIERLAGGLKSLRLIGNNDLSPILPAIVGEEGKALRFSEQLFESGFLVPAVRYPTVPKGKARLRFSCSAAHCETDIDRLIEVLGKILGAVKG